MSSNGYFENFSASYVLTPVITLGLKVTLVFRWVVVGRLYFSRHLAIKLVKDLMAI